MDNTIQSKIASWLNGNYDQATKDEITRLQQENPEELTDAFYRDLEFGTGGLRGIMGVGTNRMNRYTVGAATQGLANYLKMQFPGEDIKVAIAFDSRNNSNNFARKSADILSANGIVCYLFEELRPTPELSFAVRYLQCNAGIVITASHNPKEYNGYKVYWKDGGQLVPPHDKNVIGEVQKVDSIDKIKWGGDNLQNLIKIIGKEVDEVYLNAVKSLSLNPEVITRHADLKIVFTPLHGTGIMVPKALAKYGFSNVSVVESQAKPDGNFPTVSYPNPEEKSALALALQDAELQHADLVMATDPDADRVGVAIRNADGQMELLNGNMVASLLTYYILSEKKRKGDLKETDFVVKTIVTTDLLQEIADSFNIACFDVLTGFKYIAEKIDEHEGKRRFLCGGEESYGFLIGDFVRDKDAVSTCCLVAELAAFLADQNKTMADLLNDLYHQYAFFKEEQVSITKKGKSGAEEIQKMMKTFRDNPMKEINGSRVCKIKDYLSGQVCDVLKDTTSPTGLPKSDVLQFFTEDHSSVTVRPSGTEPKIKFYISVREKKEGNTVECIHEILDQRIENIKQRIIE